MNAIATIIRRQLLGGREIAIPTLSTLTVHRVGAQMVDAGTRLSVPFKQVVLEESEAVSLIDYIASTLGIDNVEATLMYNEWLDDVSTDTHITIDGVGVIEIAADEIELYPEFEQLLNPQPSEKVLIRRGASRQSAATLPPVKEQNNSWLLAMAIITAIASVSYLVYYFADYLLKLINNVTR